MPERKEAIIDLEHLTELVEKFNEARCEDAVFKVLTEALPELMGADRASVALLNEDETAFVIRAATGAIGPVGEGDSVPVSHTRAWEAINSDQLLVYQPNPSLGGADARLHKLGIRTQACVPIRFGLRRMGVINIGYTAADRFVDAEKKTLWHLANIVASNMMQRRMLRSAERAAEADREHMARLTVLNVLASKLSACVSTHDVYQQVVQSLREVFKSAAHVVYVELSPDCQTYDVVAVSSEVPTPLVTKRPVAQSWLTEVLELGDSRGCVELKQQSWADHQKLVMAGMTHGWSMQVELDGRVQGVLGMAGSADLAADPQNLDLVRTITRLTSVTLGRLSAQARAETAIRTFIDDSPVFVIAMDAAGKIEKVSRFGAHSLGYDVDSLIGTSFSGIHPKSQRLEVSERIKQWAGQDVDSIMTVETMMRLANGKSRWTRQNIRTIRTERDRVRIMVVCEDITAVRKLTDKLHHQVRHDGLTGLANRTHFDDSLRRVFSNAENNIERFAVLFMDLDRFKAINDSYGHSAGDKVLKSTARRIRKVLRSNDIVARVGGDEFQVILRNAQSLDSVQKVANKLRLELNQPIRIGHQELTVGTSIGISIYDASANSPDELVQQADIALYRAKELGRNNVQVFTSALSARLSQRSVMEQELVRAIDNDELRLQLQPRFRTSDGAMVAVEALVRWQHPEQGLLGPDTFIPLAEQSSLVGRITSWVLDNGLRQLSTLQKRWPYMRLGINVSARELMASGDLVRRVLSKLDDQHLPAICLELEITETALFEDLDAACEVLTELTDLGVQVALDDFGTGYASLSQLVNLPIDTVKIDRSFVSALEKDGRGRSITDTIAQLSGNLGIHCVAEGVETPWQASYLKGIEVDALQGYLLARPMWLADLVSNGDQIEARARQLLRPKSRAAGEQARA